MQLNIGFSVVQTKEVDSEGERIVTESDPTLGGRSFVIDEDLA